MSYCAVSNALMQLKIGVNGLNGSVDNPAFMESISQLHSCGLGSLLLPGNALSGSMTDAWGDLVNLQMLELSKNMLHGTLPETLRNLRNLQSLSLDRNLFYGTIPAWLGELKALRGLSMSGLQGRNPNGHLGLIGTLPNSIANLTNLKMISLGANSLTGTLPVDFCHPELHVLHLPYNQLSGGLQELLKCNISTYFDLSRNRFSGTLPNIPKWPWVNTLQVIDFSFNDLEGIIPAALYKQNVTSMIKLAHNRFNGTISSAISDMPYVFIFDVHSNRLSGSIEEGIWYLPRLTTLDISDNLFTGTISAGVGASFYLTSVLLANNNLTGQIPPSLGLPSTLTAEVFPRPDNTTKMECPRIVRKPYAQIMKDCDGSGPTQLGHQVSMVADPAYQTQQTWEADPSYYQYVGCQCLGGYHEVWSNNPTSLSCEPDVYALPSWVVPLAAILFAAGCLLLAAVGLLVWLKFTVQLRRRWLREKELHKNRLKGVPAEGSASIVVTDVESYSDLMQKNAFICTKAMGVHNAILRAAVSIHAGHVIEQEGDSWSVAFHRPVEAVAFCLQVQQALQKASWPPELEGLTAAGAQLVANSAASSGTNVSSQNTTGTGHNEPASRRNTLQSVTIASSTRGRGTTVINWMRALMPGSASSKVHHMDASSSGVASKRGAHGSSSKILKAEYQSDGSQGLRIRMGVATGWLPAAAEIKTSALFDLAKGVSDMANGGQVLLEAATFAAVHNWLTELSTVDHKGYNDALIKRVAENPSNQDKRMWLARLLSPMGFTSGSKSGAVLLDMGRYWVPGLRHVVTRVMDSAGDQAAAGATASLHLGLQNSSAGASLDAALSAAAAAVVQPDEAARDRRYLQLYTILPQTLCSRIKMWKGSFNLLEGTQRMIKGYCDAPGTLEAGFGVHAAASLFDVERPLLPPVTMVFAAVDGGINLVRKKKQVAKVVHMSVTRLMQATLLALPDGYLCREQDGVLKYMLAFKEAARAAEWCILMQEVLQHVPWPTEVLEACAALVKGSSLLSDDGGRPSASVTGAGHRPSLKMGMAQGVPEEIAPDAWGRADFFGPYVNLAARMMSATASGGQIVLSCDTAESIFSTWRCEEHLCKSNNDVSNELVVNTGTAPATAARAASTAASPRALGQGTPVAASIVAEAAQPVSQQDSATTLPATMHSQPLALGVEAATAGNAEEQPGAAAQQNKVGSTWSSGHPSPVAVTLLSSTTGNEAPTLPPKSPRTPADLENMLAAELGPAVTAGGVSRQHYPSRLVHVSAENVGTYGFKGCGAVDMVALTADVLPLVPDSYANKPRKGGKDLIPAVLQLDKAPDQSLYNPAVRSMTEFTD
eukprot:gene5596-5834_t